MAHIPGHIDPISTDDLLEQLLGPFGLSQTQMQQYSGFISQIPEELYALTDPSADIYQQYRGEQQQRLSTQLGETYSGLEQSLFQSQREARGMMGRAGLVRGRNLMGELSRDISQRGMQAGSAFGRGLYDIEQSIVDRIGAERKYIAGLEAQRRSDILRIAELAGLFKQDQGYQMSPEELQQYIQEQEERQDYDYGV